VTPPLEDPSSILEPLAPGERVVWSGSPSRNVAARIWRTLRKSVLNVLCVGLIVVLFYWRLALRLSSFHAGVDLVELGIYSALALVSVFEVALGWIAWTGRRYVVTDRRVAVVDPVVAYVFELGEGPLRRIGDRLEPAAPREGRVVTRGRFPWSSLAKAHPPEPALEGLDDPDGALAEIERARGERA
jgi:hypothetical protein